MKIKCDCIRYLALLADMKGESVYLFIEEEGLVPIEAAYPLEDFEVKTGNLIVICPYFNFVTDDGKVISGAYAGNISREDWEIVAEKIRECENIVPKKNFLYVTKERYKEVLDLFCNTYSQKLTWKLLKYFLDFLSKRKDYKNDKLCSKVPPEEKIKCYNQLWVEAFKDYLEDVGYGIK